jgi:hypothetical protein
MDKIISDALGICTVVPEYFEGIPVEAIQAILGTKP